MDDEKLTRADMQRIELAARKRWRIPEAVRDAAVTRLAMIIADPKQRPRMHASAIRCLAELDKINVAKEMHDERLEADLELRNPSPVEVRFVGESPLRQLTSGVDDDEEVDDDGDNAETETDVGTGQDHS